MACEPGTSTWGGRCEFVVACSTFEVFAIGGLTISSLNSRSLESVGGSRGVTEKSAFSLLTTDMFSCNKRFLR
jgi:hypothetical protein